MRSKRVRGVALKAFAGLSGFLLVATALVGWLHTSSGRQVYARVFRSGCPFGHADPIAVEAGRLAAVRTIRGTSPAPARPALGFRMDGSTRGDLDGWVARHHVDCVDRRAGTVLRCSNVPAAALGRTGAPIDEVTFAFAPQTQRLVNVTAMREHLSPEQAVEYAGALRDQLHASLGSPSRSGGNLSPDALRATGYATAAEYYSFSDFVADLITTNIPGDGVTVREHYMSAVD